MDLTLLSRARDMINSVTPLKTDCGLLCSHACCLPDEDGQGGVYLFPGEEALTGDWGEIIDTEMLPGVPVKMLICRGMCDRDLRPLACRFFPLTPIRLKNGTWSVRMDRRAFALCPLCPHGTNGLDSVFVQAVKDAICLIATDSEGEMFLNHWRALEKQFSQATL